MTFDGELSKFYADVGVTIIIIAIGLAVTVLIPYYKSVDKVKGRRFYS